MMSDCRKVLSIFVVLLSFLANGMECVSGGAKYSHRIIVEFQTPSLSAWAYETGQPLASPSAQAQSRSLRVMALSSQAQNHLQRIESEQVFFLQSLKQVVPNAVVSHYLNENGARIEQTYKYAFNGLTIDPGTGDGDQAIERIKDLPQVKAVYRDYARYPTLHAGNPQINAPAAWDRPEIGGQANAGRGIKVASLDGGIHHAAPMFDGTGFEYPPDYPKGGLGYKSNNNGKIIVSRAYFRPYDPPIESCRVPWPGVEDSSHGVHTSGIMAGNPVIASYFNMKIEMSGVAPAAWLMSYKVFYQSVNDEGGFYDAEALSAFEDIMQDGPDVLNNSWGDGALSIGGEFDLTDRLLTNASRAGIFVTMSAGNEGPGLGTTDHATDEYISVAASTTAKTIAMSGLKIEAPGSVPEVLQSIPFRTASFGPSIKIGDVFQFSILPAESVDANNRDGCLPWEGTPFAGKAALVQRGDCMFGEKVRNAQNAGAQFVLIYNHLDTDIFVMGGGVDGVTIPSIMIPKSAGEALVQLCEQYEDQVVMDLTCAFALEERLPDRLADFSSRGPAPGFRLKPDITAPGVEILSQGYSNETEAPQMGFSPASGTSMAAPMVSGAAAILRQAHPDWSNAYIKSAMMSTSKYLDIYTHDEKPAQPLDCGAGRLDLDRALDPGAIFAPPSLSFGLVDDQEMRTLEVTITSVTTAVQTYSLSTVYTGEGFDSLKPMLGLSFEPTQIVLEPGQSSTFTVRLDPTQVEAGDRQGYLLLDSENYHVHLPAWGRVLPDQSAPILLIDADLSGDGELTDYRKYYTDCLDELGFAYEVWNVLEHYEEESLLPLDYQLNVYQGILLFTGDNAYDTFSELDQNKLSAYFAGGGRILVMGQNLHEVFDYNEDYPPTLFSTIGGIKPIAQDFSDPESGEPDSLNDLIITSEQAAPFFQGIRLNLTPGGDGAGNQSSMDELAKLKNPYLSVPLLRYTSPNSEDQGYVAFTNTDNPTLENPGIRFLGRSIIASFGLEGVNNMEGFTSRTELLKGFILWLNHQADAAISITDSENEIQAIVFQAEYASDSLEAEALGYRWSFGDGSPHTTFASGDFTTDQAMHVYTDDGTYTVLVEIVDTYGFKSIGALDVEVENTQTLIREWSLY